MTKPDTIDGIAVLWALGGIVTFWGILETYHQFRAAEGWTASGWLAGFFLVWGVSIFCNKRLASRRSR